MSKINYGRKVGVFNASTVLHEYALDVRFSVSENKFTVLVPSAPGGEVDAGEFETYEAVTGSDLVAVKREVAAFLRKRDTTTFSDVVEYRCDVGSKGSVSFKFRVARVSEARGGGGRPRLEVPVDVSSEGVVSVSHSPFDHEPYPAKSYSGHDMEGSLPFTAERFRKCVQIRDGIEELRGVLGELFGGGGTEVAGKLDVLASGRRLLGGP